MELPVTDVTNEQSGVKKEYTYGVDTENLPILFGFLRNQCYSDRVRAVIREYGTNAMDVHLRHGIQTPIRVTLPTVLDPHFKVRDFGPALSNDDIGRIYASYGKSDKRQSKLETGALGLGCKSGFAYGDSFIVNTYRGGKLTIWNAYIDPSLFGKIAEMASDIDTTEPDGLEVIIPVKNEDMHDFRTKALDVYAYFSVAPELVNATTAELETFKEKRNVKAVYSGADWQYLGSGQSYAVMANVAYPLDTAPFTDIEMPADVREFLDGGVIIHFPNGDLKFAISRETLQYTEHTKKNVLARIRAISDSVIAETQKRFDGVTTLWSAKMLWKEVFTLGGGLYNLRSIFKNRVKFNGFPVQDDDFKVDSGLITVHKYTLGHRRLEREKVTEIPVKKEVHVVINDTDIQNGVANRLVKELALRKYDAIYVMKPYHQNAAHQYAQTYGFDYPMVSLQTMPKEKMSDYFTSTSAGWSGSSSFSPKYLTQEFSFKLGHSHYRNRRSDSWEAENVDLKKDAGVYVEIVKFEYLDKMGRALNPQYLESLLKELKKAGVPTPTKIYGFKRGSVIQAQQNPNMISFWKWLPKAISDYVTANPQLVQDFANQTYAKSRVNLLQNDLNEFANIVLKWPSLPAGSELKAFCSKVKAIFRYDEEKLTALNQLMATYNATMMNGTATHDIEKDYKMLRDRYPLLFQAAREVGTYKIRDERWSRPLEDYVAMVDVMNPVPIITPVQAVASAANP